MPPSTQLAAAFALGCAFGLAARLSRFCLLRGLRQAQGLDGDAARGSAPALQAFALALAVALLGTQALVWAGQLDWSLAPIVRTQFSVPGVLLTQIAAVRALARQGMDLAATRPVAVVGHSQGVLAVEAVATAGLTWMVWTANDPRAIQTCLDDGAWGITTDNTAQVRTWLEASGRSTAHGAGQRF